MIPVTKHIKITTATLEFVLFFANSKLFSNKSNKENPYKKAQIETNIVFG